MTDTQLTRDELLILLKIVQVFEASYLVDDPATIISQMQQRFERSLEEHGSQLAPNEETSACTAWGFASGKRSVSS